MSLPIRHAFLRKGAAYLLVWCALACLALLIARKDGLALIDFTVAMVLVACLLVERWVGGGQGASAERQEPAPSGANSRLRDEQTGLPSREALYRKLNEEWQRERRPAEPTALVLLQVRSVQSEAGDSNSAPGVATLALARALSGVLPRRADLLVRYDDATFGAVLPGTDLPGTLRVAARLRDAIAHLGIAELQNDDDPFTTSMGVAVQHGLASKGSRALLEAAEAALVRARQAGPDRLEHALLEGVDQVDIRPSNSHALQHLPSWSAERGPALHSRRN